jgi:23S rRNA (uracil1939-C5)-methyltransferase
VAGCGGCDWQHIAYHAQLRLKHKVVQSALQNIAPAVVQACIPSPLPFGYRNRIQFLANEHGQLGYRDKTSGLHIAVNECCIVTPMINMRVQQGVANTGTRMVDLRADDAGAHAMASALRMTVGPNTYRVSNDAFFQVNSAMAAQLVATALQALDVHPGDRVLDLYCGVGLFTVQIAQAGAHVTGVEGNPTSANDARHNLNTAKACSEIITAPVATALTQQHIRREAWDGVLLDPPQTGLDFDTITQLMAMRPARIVYVSCDVVSLARDLRHFTKNGWTVNAIQPLDMFPQTHHIETVVTLTRATFA